MKALRFVWFDDGRGLDRWKEVIQSAGLSWTPAIEASLEIEGVKKDFVSYLEGWIKLNRKKPPNLFLIDHNYNQNHSFGLDGSTISHLLKNEFPLVPRVCITGQNPKRIDREAISEYLKVFEKPKLDDSIDELFVIAKDFISLKFESDGKLSSRLLKCIKAPTAEAEGLLGIFPVEVHDTLHQTTPHRMARWIINELLKRPGCLYDKLEVATLLGLSTEGFQKIAHLFEQAKYKGIFAFPQNQKWWVSEVYRTLYETLCPGSTDRPQETGRRIQGITDKYYSVCGVTGDSQPPPDVVAYVDGTEDAERLPVRKEYTEIHPRHSEARPGFDALLVLRKSIGRNYVP